MIPYGYSILPLESRSFFEIWKTMEMDQFYSAVQPIFGLFNLLSFKDKSGWLKTRARFTIIKKVFDISKLPELFKFEKWTAARKPRYTVRGYRFNHLAINSTTAVAGKAGFTLASAATAAVGFMAEWSNLCPPTVVDMMVYREKSLFPTCKKWFMWKCFSIGNFYWQHPVNVSVKNVTNHHFSH